MARRRPQQLRGRGRRFAKGKNRVQPNPTWQQMKAAQTIQKYQRGRRARAALQYNVELFQWGVNPVHHAMGENSASASHGPKNTYLSYPAGFNALTTNQSSNGNFICPKFLKSKLSINFKSLTLHPDTQGLTCRVYHGRIKVTIDKLVSTHAANQAAFAAEVDAVVKRELFDSQFSSDFLEFRQRNRNIIIDGKWNVKPSLNSAPIDDSAQARFCAPDKEYVINHVLPKIKTRTVPATSSHVPLLVNMWLPFVAVECNHLTSHTGPLNIGYSSKLYFSDM